MNTMMRTVMGVVVCWSGIVCAQDQALIDRLEAIRLKHEVPALAAASFDAKSIGPSVVVGVLAHGSDAPANTHSRFHMGSLSKSMTATLAARMVERGLIRWESTLIEVLPDLKERIPESHHGVTLEQLLAHRSGLPGDTQPGGVTRRYFQLQGELTDQRIEATAIAFGQQDLRTPGERFMYCNSGYIVAGAMLEAVAGRAWEELLAQDIFAPLGITTAGFGPPRSDDGRLTQPMGHQARVAGVLPIAPGPGSDNPPVMGPGATVHMTIDDLARYAQDHLRGAQGNEALLKPDSYARLHHDPEGDGYALGWGVHANQNGEPILLQHAGSNGMWFAVIRIDLQEGFGAVTATNIAHDNAPKACGEADAALTLHRAGQQQND